MSLPLKPKTILLLSLLLCLSSSADIQLNQRTSQNQQDCRVASLGSFGYMATWSSYLHDGSSGTIIARTLALDGPPMIAEFQVNQTTEGNQCHPAIAASTNGPILIAWCGPTPNQEGTHIYGRIFDPNGQALTDEIQVSESPRKNQDLPSITTCPDNTFLVTWESDELIDQTKRGILVRRVSDTGQITGPEYNVSDTPQYACRFADIACKSNGTFVITWLEDRSSDAIRLRWFDVNSQALGESTYVSTSKTKSLTWPKCDIAPNGLLAITWDGHAEKSSQDNIHLRLYDPNGTALTNQITANTLTEGAQRNPSLAINSHHLTIAWNTEEGSEGHNIRTRTFSLDGTPLNDEITTNQHRPDDQTHPVITFGPGRNTLIAWQSENQDGSDRGIFAQTFPKLQSADLNNDNLINFTDYQTLANNWPPQDSYGQNSDLHQDGLYDSFDIWHYCTQWLSQY